MPFTTKTILVASALAFAGVSALAANPAAAASHKKMMKKGKPAHLKAGYVGAPGYVGGAPGAMAPSLFDQPASMGVFKGIPVLGDFGL